MMNFNEVEIEATQGSKYLKPGAQVLKIVEVTSGLSSAKQSPFVSIKVEAEDGSTGTREFYLNGGAFDISAKSLIKYVAAANGLDLSDETQKNTAKSKIGQVETKEQLASKLSTILVGKSLAMVVKGEHVANKDVTKDSWVKAILSDIVAPSSKVGTLKYDALKHVAGTFVAGTTSNTSSPQDEARKPSEVSWG